MVGVCVALALLVSGALSSTASAHKTLTPTAYVAIGDSLSFGYKEETFNNNFPPCETPPEYTSSPACEPPSAFEPGFVGDLGVKLAKREKSAGNELATINLGCPGETTNGIIGEGPLGAGIEAERAAESKGPIDPNKYEAKEGAPCAYQNKDGFRLKTPLGPASQLEYALGVLGAYGSNLKLVTLNGGSNDELHMISKCKTPSYLSENGYSGFTQCLEDEAGLGGHYYYGGLFTHIIEVDGTAIGTLRAYGYTGPVVLLGFYNPQAEILPGSDTLQEELNAAFESEIGADAFGPGVIYANPFDKFNYTPGKSNAHEKEHIEKYTEEYNPTDIYVNEVVKGEKGAGGDIHPTALGYKTIATQMFHALGY
jgi:lysophospholipase L1-like esterase